MKTYNLYSYLMIIGLSLLVAACNEECEMQNYPTELSIKATVESPSSRAIKDNGVFDIGESIGITLVNKDSENYNGNNYSNLCLTTYDGEIFKTDEYIPATWQGTVYAYYPYNNEVADITNIPLTAGETDYLYATPSNISYNNRADDISLSFKHAMACIRLNINNEYYLGEGCVSALEISSAALAVTGTLNGKTGEVSATDNENTYNESATYRLGYTTWTKDILVVPTGIEGAITIKIVIDNEECYITSGNIKLLPGKIYEYNIKTPSAWNSSVLTWDEIETIDAASAANGVYAVAPNGKVVTDFSTVPYGLKPGAKGVALITDNQKIMIAKNDATDGTNTRLYWGNNLYSKDVAGITNITSNSTTDFNGKANTAAIIAAYTEHGVEMDSRDMCKVLQDLNISEEADWYIPAAGQLYEINQNKAAINKMLAAIGGTNFSTSYYYWSSSEYNSGNGWFVNFNRGGTNYYSKNFYYLVRFVQDLN